MGAVEMIDTGDIIRDKATRLTHMVACVHEPILHTAGFPELRLRLIDVEFVSGATQKQREDQLDALAHSSGTGHRPECARERLRKEAAQAGEYVSEWDA